MVSWAAYSDPFEENDMPRLRQVSRADATPEIQTMYDLLFGDRDPVADPGTETGTPET